MTEYEKIKLIENCKNLISDECVSSKLKRGIEISIRIGIAIVSYDKITCNNQIRVWFVDILNPSSSDPGRRLKINLKCYFHTSLSCLKTFYEGIKDFIETFEAPQRRVKIKISDNFYFNTTPWDARHNGKGKL